MEITQEFADAMQVIRDYDPDTYGAMLRSPWHVTSNLGQFLIGWLGESESFAMRDIWHDGGRILAAYGATVRPGEQPGARNPWPVSLINTANASDWSEDHAQPGQWFLATVLVHEFRHTQQNNKIMPLPVREADAFRAGSRFAQHLPPQYGRDIYATSQRNARTEIEYVSSL